MTVAVALLVTPPLAATPGARRALLVGINDYSASKLRGEPDSDVPKRKWTNLEGAVNDVHLMREVLIARHGFAPEDILLLTDQEATRAAILNALEKHLLRPAKKGDVLLFYYSGHGSQVRNSLSTEKDKRDESLVPADSRLGSRDIRDKELSVVFNRILDRGVRLTVVLDACHSGSGTRGLNGGFHHRGVAADPRDAADATDIPSAEARGALVFAAAEDFDLAYETRGDDGIRGAFSWALARSLRDADPEEAASDTFLRAVARLRSDMPAQNPILAGRSEVKLAPFLGASPARRNNSRGIAVESVRPDGTYTLMGGWVHGLTKGTRLQVAGRFGTELEVLSLVGAGRSVARIVQADVRGVAIPALDPGALLEISAWSAPALKKLRIWIPRGSETVIADARKLLHDAAARGRRCIDDPTEVTPTELLRWREHQWERVVDSDGNPPALFVQLPAMPDVASVVDGIDAIERIDSPDGADYILTGRLTRAGVEYAWVRPGAVAADAKRSPMPLRSAWKSVANGDVYELRAALLRLIRMHGWHGLEPPSGNGSHYRLAIRDARDGGLVENRPLIGKQGYQLVLRLRDPAPATPLYARYVYAFAIDSFGRSVLLFPRSERGSVENRLPLTDLASRPIKDPPAEIPLGDCPSFLVTTPYGMDSYFLLTTDSPLSSTSCLEWDGVRAPPSMLQTPLEQLLAQSSRTRGEGSIQTSPHWSIEKLVFESVPPKRSSP